jgi:hypothetical protein
MFQRSSVHPTGAVSESISNTNLQGFHFALNTSFYDAAAAAAVACRCVIVGAD